jgi:hypothetical protein
MSVNQAVAGDRALRRVGSMSAIVVAVLYVAIRRAVPG